MRTIGASNREAFLSGKAANLAHNPPFIQAVSTAMRRPVFFSDSARSLVDWFDRAQVYNSTSMPSGASSMAA